MRVLSCTAPGAFTPPHQTAVVIGDGHPSVGRVTVPGFPSSPPQGGDHSLRRPSNSNGLNILHQDHDRLQNAAMASLADRQERAVGVEHADGTRILCRGER